MPKEDLYLAVNKQVHKLKEQRRREAGVLTIAVSSKNLGRQKYFKSDTDVQGDIFEPCFVVW